MNQKFTTARIATMIAAAGLILGALAPWVTGIGVTIPGTASGMDGHLTGLVGLGSVAALGIFRERIITSGVILAAIVATLLGLSQVNKVNGLVHAGYGANSLSIGWGLWLTVICAVGLILGGFFLLREQEVKADATVQQD